jgi:hypothetical protein
MQQPRDSYPGSFLQERREAGNIFKIFHARLQTRKIEFEIWATLFRPYMFTAIIIIIIIKLYLHDLFTGIAKRENN